MAGVVSRFLSCFFCDGHMLQYSSFQTTKQAFKPCTTVSIICTIISFLFQDTAVRLLPNRYSGISLQFSPGYAPRSSLSCLSVTEKITSASVPKRSSEPETVGLSEQSQDRFLFSDKKSLEGTGVHILREARPLA
jgi:hypothetical protein